MKKSLLAAMLLFGFVIGANAQTAIQEFNFNGSLSNTSNTVTFIGNAKYVKGRTGVANSAININNSILEATISNLPLSNASRTVSIWVKYNDVSKPNYIWGYGTMLKSQYFGILQQGTTDSKSDLSLAGWGPMNDVIVTTTIANKIWYNYTVTYDGLTSKIYRNGELIKSSISPRKMTSSMVFGIGKMGPSVSINADIDDLKIYDVALSASEVAALYEENSVTPVGTEIVAKTTIKNEAAKGKATAKTSIKPNAAVAKTTVVLAEPSEIMTVKKSEIFSSKGEKVLTGDKNEIDLTKLPEGTYLLKVVNSTTQGTGKKLTSN